MPKYDGPSYQKDQDRQKKFKFPFYRDTQNVTNKEGSLKTSALENEDSQSVNQNIKTNEKKHGFDFTAFQKDNTSVRNYLSTIGKEEQMKQSEIKKQKKQVEKRIKQTNYSKESLKHAATPFQEGRSSTPFKVQKIPSPYYGFQDRATSKGKNNAIDYLKITLALEKKPEQFLLFEEYLLNKIELPLEDKIKEIEAVEELESVKELE
ncbi:MAG: DNA translocase FtsK, partial [Carnobacterium inhibens]